MRSFDFKVCLKFDSTCNGFLSFVVLQNLSIHVGFPFDLICRLTFPFLFHSNSPRNVQKFLWFLIIQITVPKLSISQSEAMSTVLISYDIKSLTWYGYDIMSLPMLAVGILVSPWVFWLNYVTPKFEPRLHQTRLICRRSVPKRYD